jgi:hypothetical protein
MVRDSLALPCRLGVYRTNSGTASLIHLDDQSARLRQLHVRGVAGYEVVVGKPVV